MKIPVNSCIVHGPCHACNLATFVTAAFQFHSPLPSVLEILLRNSSVFRPVNPSQGWLNLIKPKNIDTLHMIVTDTSNRARPLDEAWRLLDF